MAHGHDFETTLAKIQTMLRAMQGLLEQAGETSRAASVANVAASFEGADPEEAKSAAREARQMFGGMGSLMDVVVMDKAGRPDVDWNEEFHGLGEALHDALVELITDC